MRFVDRPDAGRRLAEALSGYADADAAILGIPRGGVVVGAEVARALHAPLGVVLPRKVRAPWNPELGLGAVAPGVRVLDERLIRRLRVSDAYMEEEIETQLAEIRRRERTYRGERPPVSLEGRVAVVADDGIATGGTAVAALRWTRAQAPSRVVLAVPVAPRAAVSRLAEEADELVVLDTPEPFLAVGEWYEHFDQTGDDEVVALLADLAGSSV